MSLIMGVVVEPCCVSSSCNRRYMNVLLTFLVGFPLSGNDQISYAVVLVHVAHVSQMTGGWWGGYPDLFMMLSIQNSCDIHD